MIKMNKTVHELLSSRRKNSVLKSMFISKNREHEKDFTNTFITIEPYDNTFLNVENRKGSDYIVEQLQKQLNNTELSEKIENHLGQKINNIRILYYSDLEHFETVLIRKNDEYLTQAEAYGFSM